MDHLTALRSKRLLLGVSGGIAAYKIPQLVRLLRQAGAEVQVVMTRNAARFVTATTLQAVSERPVRDDLWDPQAEAAMGHIELARWADAVVIAPTTADLLARLASGRADDLLTTLCLASRAPLLLAPAMNQAMWSHPATQRNLSRLEADGALIIGPDSGDQACGDVGPGRMVEPELLSAAVARRLAAGAPTGFTATEFTATEFTATEFTATAEPGEPPAILSGCRVLITAGPTREAIDPVRFISNHSSGKQGFALAEAAREAGARVTLISGPVNLDTPAGVERVDVISARDMAEAVAARIADTDLFIGVAAVADYRPEEAAPHKLKKRHDDGQAGAAPSTTRSLMLVENPDIIATVAAHPQRPVTVGFAAETDRVIPHARAKLERKGLDLMVVNDVGDASIGFHGDHNAVTLLWPDGEESLPRQSKQDLARSLIARIARRFVDQLALANRESVAVSK